MFPTPCSGSDWKRLPVFQPIAETLKTRSIQKSEKDKKKQTNQQGRYFSKLIQQRIDVPILNERCEEVSALNQKKRKRKGNEKTQNCNIH